MGKPTFVSGKTLSQLDLVKAVDAAISHKILPKLRADHFPVKAIFTLIENDDLPLNYFHPPVEPPRIYWNPDRSIFFAHHGRY